MIRAGIALATLLWLAGIGWGFTTLARHEMTPGAKATAGADWPAGTSLARSPGGPTLVLFAHPRCPCMKATLEELDRLVARTGGAARVSVHFFSPRGADWSDTDVTRRAACIPGVSVLADPDGVEARRFGALTSGDAFLYDAGGRLVFRGGITPSRGHQGESAGRSAIEAFLKGGRPRTATAPVFGCPIRSQHGAQLEERGS